MGRSFFSFIADILEGKKSSDNVENVKTVSATAEPVAETVPAEPAAPIAAEPVAPVPAVPAVPAESVAPVPAVPAVPAESVAPVAAEPVAETVPAEPAAPIAAEPAAPIAAEPVAPVPSAPVAPIAAEPVAVPIAAEPVRRIAGNAIEVEAKVIKAIMDTIESVFRGNRNVDFGKKDLIVWIADNLLFESLSNANFRESLMLQLADMSGIAFRQVTLKFMATTVGVTYTQAIDGVYLEVSGGQEISKGRTARISVYEGQGSLLQSEYILNSVELQKPSFRVYNIGVGVFVKNSNGLMRKNHIVINDDENDLAFVKNKYVSRSHAHIDYDEDYGFRLFVEPNGTAMAGKRTRIIRGDKLIELNNTLVPEPLVDGDIIELSKNVLLLFEVTGTHV